MALIRTENFCFSFLNDLGLFSPLIVRLFKGRINWGKRRVRGEEEEAPFGRPLAPSAAERNGGVSVILT